MQIIIKGNPIPLKRARVYKNIFYDPQYVAKKNFAHEVKEKITIENFPRKEPIELRLKFIFEMPKSWSIKKKEKMEFTPYLGRKDLDNCIKWVGDSLNGILWEDDALIYKIDAIKLYGYEGQTIIEI